MRAKRCEIRDSDLRQRFWVGFDWLRFATAARVGAGREGTANGGDDCLGVIPRRRQENAARPSTFLTHGLASGCEKSALKKLTKNDRKRPKTTSKRHKTDRIFPPLLHPVASRCIGRASPSEWLRPSQLRRLVETIFLNRKFSEVLGSTPLSGPKAIPLSKTNTTTPQGSNLNRGSPDNFGKC